jgi:hypothetical protein
MKLLLALTVAHLIGDFPLQGNFLALNKGKYDFLLFVHALIWTGCVCAVFASLDQFSWGVAAFLLVGHFMIDRWKARRKDKTDALTEDLWLDQSLHFLQLAIVAFI